VDERERRLGRVLARWLATLAAVGAVLALVDLRTVAARLRHLDGRYVAAFLVLSLPFYLLCAGRWWFTAARVGAPLTYPRALYDYYVSTMLNQILPVGIGGDLVRAVRHHGRLRRELAATEPSSTFGPAATSIVLERLSGFAGLAVFVLASAIVWLARGRREFVPVGAGALASIVVGALVVARAIRRPGTGRLARLRSDGRAAFVERGALWVQLGFSTAAVAILMLLFTCAGRAAGTSLDPFTVVQVVPLVLAATTFPWAFGGWGAREATCAALYRLLGLDTVTGVAVSITFGILSLAAAAPGLIALAIPEARRRPSPSPSSPPS
jgi:uncharacterized membrane protein YbhN (UPF0104 family)